jgi:vacuolar-type H+-ATPase subunit I/STV1
MIEPSTSSPLSILFAEYSDTIQYLERLDNDLDELDKEHRALVRKHKKRRSALLATRDSFEKRAEEYRSALSLLGENDDQRVDYEDQ